MAQFEVRDDEPRAFVNGKAGNGNVAFLAGRSWHGQDFKSLPVSEGSPRLGDCSYSYEIKNDYNASDSGRTPVFTCSIA